MKLCYLFQCEFCGRTHKQPQGVVTIPKCPECVVFKSAVLGESVTRKRIMNYVGTIRAGVAIVYQEEPT